MLRFLADGSCDFAAVRALRQEGCDVLAVAEALPGGDDEHVIELALAEQRILLTEDNLGYFWNPDNFAFGSGMPRGILSVTVPGAAWGWDEMQTKYGKLSFRQTLQPAIGPGPALMMA